PSRGSADKAKRPVLAACKYIVKMIDDILADYPAGQVPTDGFCFRDAKELEPFLKEPQSEGWKSIHEIKKMGIF
ncbi:MAG: creatininase family protein, partial [Suipraeoptans sp.]